MEPMKRWQLKLSAKEQLKGKWNKMALFSFLVSAIPIGLLIAAGIIYGFAAIFNSFFGRMTESYLYGEVGMSFASGVAIFLSIVMYLTVLIVELVLDFGFKETCIKLRSGEQISLGMLFEKFSIILKILRLVLFLLIPLVPYTLISALCSSRVGLLWSLISVAATVGFIYVVMRASMCVYILLENPYTTVWRAVKQSWHMMRGHTARFFVLQMSFLGWLLLGSICFVGLFWIEPYIEMTNVNFYYDLKRYCLENQR